MTGYTLTPPERETYRRYAGIALPRHTSYPIAPFWNPEYGPADLCDDLRLLSPEGRPLSLYIHIPYCERLCYYCACTKEIVPPNRRNRHELPGSFLDSLEIEAGRFADA